MKSLLKVLPFALVLSCLCSCTHSVHLVNFSEDVPLLKKSVAKPIEAHAQQFVILGFVTQTDYVNQAYHQLQSQCPNGTIGAIATK